MYFLKLIFLRNLKTTPKFNQTTNRPALSTDRFAGPPKTKSPLLDRCLSMAPKKKQHQQNKSSSSQSKPKPQSSSSGPRLQISADNENRLRRLLLNSGRSAPASSPALADDTLSKAQKAKKLRSLYEKLSCEGFSNDQIELALSALKVNFVGLNGTRENDGNIIKLCGIF